MHPFCLRIIFFANFYAYLQNKIQPGLPKPRFFTVGRLDVATSGLIIITNDGNLIVLDNIYLENGSLGYPRSKLDFDPAFQVSLRRNLHILLQM
jgi:hypothetical protein